jgi:cell division protein FtsZ
VNVGNLDVPAVMRTSHRRTTVEAMSANGMGTYDIPAFLRKQAD